MLIERVGHAFLDRTRRSPWTPVVGAGRSLLALGTLGTLAATPTTILLSPIVGSVPPPACTGPARFALWCAVPGRNFTLASGLAILILVWTLSGWLPRWSAVPHWWVSWSFIANLTVQDGGDQITAVLTLLLIPVLLTDHRRWHWTRPSARDGDPVGSPTRWVVAHVALGLIALQVAGVYFQAAVSKLGVAEWADGSAMFYWFNNVIFGVPGYLRPVTDAVTDSPLLLATLTWGSLVLEFALGIAIFLRRPVRRALLVPGILFHDAIALTMGLISFDLAMTAALLLYLVPTEDLRELTAAHLGRLRRRLTRHRSPASGPTPDPVVDLSHVPS